MLRPSADRRSTRTRSGGEHLHACSASSPLVTTVTWCPSRVSIRLSSRAVLSSSSATRMSAWTDTSGSVCKCRAQRLVIASVWRLSAMRAGIVGLLLAFGAATLAADVSTKEATRIREAATVLKEIHSVPDKDIPQELWDKAQCVLVVPGLKKAAFVFGGEYGAGLMSCRQNGGGWSAPIFMQVGKGSW